MLSRFKEAREARRLKQDYLREYHEYKLHELNESFDRLFSLGPNDNLYAMCKRWQEIKVALKNVSKDSPLIDETYAILVKKLPSIIEAVARDSKPSYVKVMKQISKAVARWEIKQRMVEKKRKNSDISQIPVAEVTTLTEAEIEQKQLELSRHLRELTDLFAIYPFQEIFQIYDDKKFISWWHETVNFINFHQSHPEFDIRSLVEKLRSYEKNIIASYVSNPSKDVEIVLQAIQSFLNNEGDFWWREYDATNVSGDEFDSEPVSDEFLAVVIARLEADPGEDHEQFNQFV